MYLIEATHNTALVGPRHAHVVGAYGVEFFRRGKGIMIHFLTPRSYIAFRESGRISLLTPRDHECRMMQTLYGREIEATAYDDALIAWHELTMNEWAIVSSPWKWRLDYAKPSHIVKLYTATDEVIIDTITLDGHTHQFLILNPYQINAELTIPVLGGWPGPWAAYELLSWEGMPVLRHRPELKEPDTTLTLGYARGVVPAGLLYKEPVTDRETLLAYTFVIIIED